MRELLAVCVLLAVLAMLTVAIAAECTAYPARVTAVIDGDTVEAVVDLGLDTARTVRVRLAGIDAPEVRGTTRLEGLVSAAWLRAWVQARDSRVRLFVEGTDKYGRVVARLIGADGEDASAASLAAQKSVPYR